MLRGPGLPLKAEAYRSERAPGASGLEPHFAEVEPLRKPTILPCVGENYRGGANRRFWSMFLQGNPFQYRFFGAILRYFANVAILSK